MGSVFALLFYWIDWFFQGIFTMELPPALQAEFDTAEASLAAAAEAETELETANADLATAQEHADACAAASKSAHVQAASDAQALIDALKAHYGLS